MLSEYFIMTDQELKIKYTAICSSLSTRRLKPAFDMLGKLISENGLGIYHDEHRNLEETYNYMLKYTVEGVFDPERQKVYRKLITSIFELADKVNEVLRLRLSISVEYEKKRMIRNSVIPDLKAYLVELEVLYSNDRGSFQPGKANSRRDKDSSQSDKITSASEDKENQQKMQNLFYHIWFSDKLTSEEINHLSKFLSDKIIPLPYRSFMITSVMLSLQRFFDAGKIMLLFDHCSSKEAEISQRALVGLLINLYKYDSRIPFYQEIAGRLKILNENPSFKRNIERIIIQFIRSKGTEKLQQRIRDEILPEMIKISPYLKNKINLDSLMEESISDDKNPEWLDILNETPGLMNKMEEFTELQMKGDDVFMGSFSMLKSFHFFYEISNWFLPFFPDNPEIAENLDVKDQLIRQMVESVERAPFLCNSDKYSFCLSIQKLPKDNIEFMSQAMKAEMEQVKELRDDEELLNPGLKEEFISNQFIQDLYRFYKLFPRKADFEDIFNWCFDFHNKQAVGDILKEDTKVLRNIAEYYLAKDHFEEAAGIFSYLLEQEKSGELYQKIAWCYQKMNEFETALDAYLKAELYGVDQLWNHKKIALCFRNLKKPDKALEYYRVVEKIKPEDLGNQLNIGNCLLELEEYEEALKCYFKIEYLAPGNKKVWRPIAWCSFITGKKDQAEKYFRKLIEDEPNKHDFINMGHVQWSLGNRKAALDYYKKSITENGFSEAEFLEVFEQDLLHLINQGVDKDDVPIMLDQLRYFLEK